MFLVKIFIVCKKGKQVFGGNVRNTQNECSIGQSFVKLKLVFVSLLRRETLAGELTWVVAQRLWLLRAAAGRSPAVSHCACLLTDDCKLLQQRFERLSENKSEN